MNDKNRLAITPRRIYAVDVGSTLQERFAWASVDPEGPKEPVGSSSIEQLCELLVADLQANRSIALGFEAPLFIPVPTAVSRLSKGRANEGNRSWAAPPGLAVASLGLHQAAWILRYINEHHDSSVSFQVAPDNWPPSPETTTLFCWEAFVSGPAHSETHVRDAATAAMSFLNEEHRLAEVTTVTTKHPLSLIGAAALWSGLPIGVEVLRTPTVVLQPALPFRGRVVELSRGEG